MSKGIYIGVDDKARKVTKAYIGVDGVARKILKGYIGDANGKARLFYSAEKYYWWKRYPITSWSQSNPVTFSNMNSYKINGQDSYGYKQYELSQSGTFDLSGGFDVPYTSENTGYNESTIRTAAASFYNYYRAGNGIVTQRAIVFVTSYSYGVFSSGGYEEFMSGHVIFAQPTQRSSQYTLVKDLAKIYPDNGYNYYQSWVDSDFYGAKYAYIYDGYYYEYDGYHE